MKDSRRSTKLKKFLTFKNNATKLNSTKVNATESNGGGMAKKQLVLNVPTELRAWLEQKAKAEDRSMNQIATRALEQARKAEVEKAA